MSISGIVFEARSINVKREYPMVDFPVSGLPSGVGLVNRFCREPEDLVEVIQPTLLSFHNVDELVKREGFPGFQVPGSAPFDAFPTLPPKRKWALVPFEDFEEACKAVTRCRRLDSQNRRRIARNTRRGA